jgi:hypothetical protein
MLKSIIRETLIQLKTKEKDPSMNFKEMRRKDDYEF